MSKRTVYRTCTLCEAICGLELTVEGGRVTRIQGDEADPFSKGHICPKAHGLMDLDADPDRIRTPLRKREDGSFEPIGWEEAWDLAAERLKAQVEAGGADSVALYRGNPTIHDAASLVYWNVLQQALPTTNRYSAGSVDTWPRYVQVGTMFGGMLHIAVPDLDRTDHLLMFGANPHVSNGSLMTAPGMKKRLRDIQGRGGRIVVVDPRRTETADAADEHVYVRPGGDAALVLAMVHTLFDEGLVAPGRLEPLCADLERLPGLLEAYAPERVASACGVPAETIRRLTRDFASAPRAAAYGRMGTCVQAFGTLASWGIELLNVLTGNFDREGGVLFARPAASLDFAVGSAKEGAQIGRYRSRVSGYDEVFGELPVAALCEEIETPGDGQIRALLIMAGNPVRTAPNSARFEKALAELDFMVALDIYVNETTRHADLIIPPSGPLDHGHYDLALYNLAVRNVARYSPPAKPMEEGAEPIWRTLVEISKRIMGIAQVPTEQVDAIVLGRFAERVVSASPFAGRLDAEKVVQTLQTEHGPGLERLLDLLIRTGAYGDGFGLEPDGLTLERLAAAPHGIDLGPLEPALPGKLATPSGKIELAPERIVSDLDRLADWIDEGWNETGERPFLLIGRRDIRSMNSWLHNLPSLAKGRERATLEICDDDARALGLAEGESARLESRVGELVVPVTISSRMMRGVVSLPHGFGHDVEGTRLRVAARKPGANANALTDEDAVDVPSGASVLNGVPISIARASG